MIKLYGGVIVDIKKRVIIVGGCIAAKEAAASIRSIDSLCNITMISSEEHLPYYRPMLSRAICQELPKSRLCLAPNEWYKEHNIELILDTKVTKILTDTNTVVTDKGDNLEYTHLLIATGAKNFIPVPEAINTQGVFSIRSYDDILNLRGYLPNIKKAIIVGTGLLGLEAAWELYQQGIDITLIEFANHVLPKQLDNEAANFLALHLKEKGANILYSNSVRSIIEDKSITGVKCSNGEILPCDLLLFATGAYPNLEITRGTNISTDKGILVDNYMQTNISNIYAAGDVAQNQYNTSGVWVPAMEMGKIAGYNIAGKNTEYMPAPISTMLTAFDIRVFSIGEIIEDPSMVTETIVDSKNKFFKKLFAKNGILVGAILIGDISQGTRLAKQLGLISLTEAKNIIE